MTSRLRQWSARPVLVLLASLLLTACGMTAPRHNAGYADLDSLGMFDTDRVMALSVGPTLIRIAALALDDDEPELSALLRGVKGVRIRIYEIDGDAGRVAQRISRMSQRLRHDHWTPVLLVREGSEQTHMLVRARGERILGLTLISSDGDSEAVVINLIGNLDPQHFSSVMKVLAVDTPSVKIAPGP